MFYRKHFLNPEFKNTNIVPGFRVEGFNNWKLEHYYKNCFLSFGSQISLNEGFPGHWKLFKLLNSRVSQIKK